jgi:dGTPase
MTSPRLDPHEALRVHPEPKDPLRAPFELDRHRIVNCTAFRRLQHKTQVFAPSMHDHFRNRLTHSLEVSQIARCLAGNLEADPDLSEAIALAHDLGHPPFSHAGENALNELMAGHGGFNHNAHSARVVKYLEHPYPAFRGLNLTRATLAGLRAHATQFDVPSEQSPLSDSVEAQVVSLADRIAYDLHDLEDAMGAGLVQNEDLDHLTIWSNAAVELGDGRPVHAIRRPVLDRILNGLLSDAIGEFHPHASGKSTGTNPLRLSVERESALQGLEQFLLERVYRNQDVARADAEGRQIIHELFSGYLRDPHLMPDRFFERVDDQGPHRVMSDYIAGMTDNYCVLEHRRIRQLAL